MNPFYEIGILSIVFLTLDGIWIGLIMQNHYNKTIKSIQGEDPSFKIIPAILCYFVLIGGLFYFVSQKLKKFDFIQILSLTVPFGLCVFGTFDFTSSAILKNWDLTTAFIDLIWGTIVCSSSVMVAVYLKDKFHNDNEQVNSSSHSS